MEKKKFNSKLTLKKISISKLQEGEMQLFVGGAANQLMSDRLCTNTRSSQRTCDIIIQPPLPPLGPTAVGCCTHVNCC